MTDKDKTFTSSFDRLPNKEAQKAFDSKTLITSAEFANFKAYQHALAFTVAGLADKDMLTEIHKAVKSAIDNGTSFNDFKKTLKPFLVSKGWLSPELTGDDEADKALLKDYERTLNRRLKTIYHTNKQTAYAAGKWERIQKTKDFLPFLQYLPSASINKRDGHKAYYGIVRHADDPIWQSIFPPNGFGCKCSVKQITKSKARELGITEDETIAELPTPEFDSNFDRLGSLLRLAEDKHGVEFREKLYQALTQAHPKVIAQYEQEQIIKKWALGYNSISRSFAPKTQERIQELGLTIPEAVAIKEYTGGGFIELNQSLNTQVTQEMSDVAEVLRQALNKLPDYDGVVIRRTRLPKEVLENHKLYGVVTYPAFTSATYDKLDKFTGYPHRLIIKSKTGKKVDWLSSNFGELEVLFTSPSKFYVESIKKGDYNKDGFEFEITLREI